MATRLSPEIKVWQISYSTSPCIVIVFSVTGNFFPDCSSARSTHSRAPVCFVRMLSRISLSLSSASMATSQALMEEMDTSPSAAAWTGVPVALMNSTP